MGSATHPAVVTVAPSAPLEIHQVPTPTPEANEVKVLVQWTASTPLDLHQASSHLLVKPPQILGDGVAGTVIEVGSDVRRLRVGDQVFGFTWRSAREKAHQLFCVTEERLLGKIPEGRTMQESVVLGNNFVTAWHTITADFGFDLPWPKPDGYVPPEEDDWVLVWGSGSSSGMYTLQILKWYGYKNLIAVSSKKHHGLMRQFGAKECFDYRDSDAVERINEFQKSTNKNIKFLLDCIGSLDGSVKPLSQIAKKGSKVAVLLPVIVKDATDGSEGVYSMDTQKSAPWEEGVEAVGVRTHFWMDNAFLADHLESEIMPAALTMNIVQPNDQVIVGGETMLDRAEKALSMMRNKQVSGARLVWRIAEDDEVKKWTRNIPA